MDLYRLSKLLNSSRIADRAGATATTAAPLTFAPLILESFIPGYGIISRFLSQSLGFDVGYVVSAGLFLFALAKAWAYVSRNVRSFLTEYASSLIYIDEGDEMFSSVLDWIAQQHVGKAATRLKAVTKHGASPGEDQMDKHHPGMSTPASDELFHFGKWAAKVPPKYEPYYGSYMFIHNYRLFIFERGKRERQTAVMWRSTSSEEQHIQIKTLGWSTAPLKALLAQIKQWSTERENDVTVIKRPQSKDTRRREGAWSRVTSRPSRPMETVVLDPKQKEDLIEDVNEYLSPAAPTWYASRGIPLRRGYLFHGPPGTGKSSLSFALAGVFGLDIHVVSLLDPSLTETDLQQLFNSLPRRCIVLLEDIDTAGLKREESSLLPSPTAEDSKFEKDYEKISSAEASKDASRGSGRRGARIGGRAGAININNNNSGTSDPTSEKTSGISLSGLLNAIDGVASHEGRVLVMTTNHPDCLDAALIRPGRVDMQVAFTLATRHQIEEIYVKMYASDPPRSSSSSTPPAQHSLGSVNHQASHKEPVNRMALKREYSRGELQELAVKFGDVVPADQFSPAEVQNFLITRKKDPEKALAEAEAWKDALLEAKRRRN